jgi:ferredoxin
LFESVKIVTFSPTGTTRRITNAIAEAVGPIDDSVDLTHYFAETVALPAFSSEDLVIFGTPVYGGRAQPDALMVLNKMEGNGAQFAAVVVYGNRAFEDALIELLDIASDAGFQPVAAGAFVGEHSYSTVDTPIAHGRPDGDDLDKAAAFGRALRRKLESNDERSIAQPVPGNRPYRQRSLWQEMAPSTDHMTCIRCGVCVTVCPKGANQLTDQIITDKRLCMMCCACIKLCPVQARAADDRVLAFARKLSAEQADRKEPVWYL